MSESPPQPPAQRGRGAGPAWTRRLRPSTATVALMLAAGVSVALVHRDPWRGERPSVPLVSNQSAARRVFPNLGEQELESARIELNLAAPAGASVRLVPRGDGRHQLYRDETLLGWADPVAVESLWSSLRMATTLRAVDDDSAIGEAKGSIVVVVGDETLTLELAGETPDGSGYYGRLLYEQAEPWVVEAEVAALITQPPETWLARRLLLAEPAEVTRVAFAERPGEGPERARAYQLARGQDGLWRAQETADGGAALLATGAVEGRLDRLFAAPVETLVPREQVAANTLEPWFEITTARGETQKIALGGACPKGAAGRVVDRGPGMLGCIPGELVERWPPRAGASGLLESQLIPWAYGRVLAVDMRRPRSQRLSRRGSAWVLDDASAAQPQLRELAEPEVFRWFSEVSAIEVGPGGREFTPDVDLVVESDTTQNLRIRCGRAPVPTPVPTPTPTPTPSRGEGELPGPAQDGPMMCQRDDGPLLVVRSQRLPSLAFTAETFADRQLTRFGAESVRAVELLPGPALAQAGARQSVRKDMGVWRLDTPEHPDGSDALDELRLEELLATVSALRADAWAEPAERALERTIRIERTAARDGGAIAIELREGCVVTVSGRARAAQLDPGSCTVLRGDLLYNDPLRDWIGRARTIEWTDLEAPDEPPIRGRRAPVGDDAWELERGDAEHFERQLEAWSSWRAAGVRGGAPSRALRWRVRFQLVNGLTVTAEIGAENSWARVSGVDWYYVPESQP